MNSSSNQSGTGSNNPKIQSFLEALRNSQSRSFENGNQEPKTNPFAEFQKKKETEKRRSELFFQARQQEWNKVFSAKEKQKEQRIEEIRRELQNLAKQVKKLDTNLTKAVHAPIIEAGEYQESFLTHIQKTIQLYSLNVGQANSWLEMYNRRSAKKGYYTGMAKSRGTSFTQSNERAVATSVG